MSHDDTAPGPSRLVPTKHILTPAHLAAFKRSDTHREVTQFIHELNDAIVGLKISDVQPTSVSAQFDWADNSVPSPLFEY